MERLTTRNIAGVAVFKESYDCERCGEGLWSLSDYGNGSPTDRLAEYEEADEQGLLLRLPCKVGDIVYYEHPYASVHTGIQEYQITNIMISQNKKGVWTKKYRAMMLLNGKIIDSQINFSFDDIGKTVFLTKAKAEAAVEKMKGEEHE